jgi:hypothetical protein
LFLLFDENYTHTIPIQHQGANYEGMEQSVGSFTGQIIFPAGDQLKFQVVRSGTAGESASELVINGYLEDE